ncbi:MAG: metallophosphoesterase family protein [Verrucomicrobia bacterium]|nr:metallophosphoesterase family protein [Verrucomicrobiota bacterium]
MIYSSPMLLPRLCFRLMLVLCALAPVAGRAQAEVTGIYLTWRDDPATTITVNWVNLYAEAPATVWYRRGPGEWRRAEGGGQPLRPSGLWVRRVQLRELEADTVYEVAIGAKAPGGTQGVHTFRTMPRELRRAVTFVTGGDMMHTREMVDAMNKQAGRLDPDFALLGGDLAYANNEDATRWVDFFQAWYLAKAEPTRHLFHVALQPSGRARIVAVNDQGEIFDEVSIAAPRTRPVHP